MKIAIPKDGEMLNQHFGKSRSFAIISVEDSEIKGIEEISAETLLHNHGGLSDLLVSSGVSLVITGGIGAGAYNALTDKNLMVIRGASGRIEDVLQEYVKGSLKDKESLCNHHGEHHK